MLATMIEEGPEAFVQRWRRYAADATVFARPEGSPLLEVLVAGAVLQLLERTNPYLGVPGSARVLVQASADALEACVDEARRLEVPSRGTLRAQGPVLAREGRVVAIDAGAPLLVALDGGAGEDVAVGDWVRCEAEAPIHGFVLPPEAPPPVGSDGRGIDDAP